MRFRIDLKIFIFLIIFYFTRQIEIYSILMLFALIHELGHLLTGLLVGMQPEKLELMPFGVAISFKIKPEEYNKKIKKGNQLEIKKILVALAGPITNFIVIVIILNLNIELFKALTIIYTNFLIVIFNLLPIYPLDGGQILNRVLRIIYGNFEAYKISNSVNNIIMSILTALASIGLLCTKNIAIIFIIIFLWYLIIKENKKYKEISKYFKSFHKLDKKSNYNI